MFKKYPLLYSVIINKMINTDKELENQQFEVIADFPDNHFGVIGTILDRDWAKYPNDDETQKAIWRISDFPHLFRKIN